MPAVKRAVVAFALAMGIAYLMATIRPIAAVELAAFGKAANADHQDDQNRQRRSGRQDEQRIFSQHLVPRF